MKYLFLFFCFLLIFYNFKTVALMSTSKNKSIVLSWKIIDNKYLFHILPHDVFVLLDNDNFYLYLETKNEETYVPAVNLKTNYKVNVLNYIYLREWSDFYPKVLNYDKSSADLVDIINSLVNA